MHINIFIYIHTYIYRERSVECLKRNKEDGFEKLRIIKSKRQVPNLKNILTKNEFSQKQVGVSKQKMSMLRKPTLRKFIHI